MMSNDEKVRAAVAEQAADWLVSNDEGPLDAPESAALTAWLKASPAHVEEFLGVSVIARDLREAGRDPEYSIENVLARARTGDDGPMQAFWSRASVPARSLSERHWLTAAVTMASLAVVSLGLFSLWKLRPITQVSARGGTAALRFETRHGEQLIRRLADNSVLHLNTDSAISILYSNTERRLILTSGQAYFEVAHEPDRAFRVFAGTAEVVDLGTKFDVRLERDSTLVTVVEGRVAVGPAPASAQRGAGPQLRVVPRFVEVGADQQIRVAAEHWPATLTAVDAQHITSWLRREVVFEHEPLERVAAEFNRYAPKSIEIATPALRNLQISGAFATDDAEVFVAFLRSLKGVRVEVTATRIRVSQE